MSGRNTGISQTLSVQAMAGIVWLATRDRRFARYERACALLRRHYLSHPHHHAAHNDSEYLLGAIILDALLSLGERNDKEGYPARIFADLL